MRASNEIDKTGEPLAKAPRRAELPKLGESSSEGARSVSWFDLPKEIRLEILSFTDLVVKDHPHHAVPGLRIWNRKILSNNRSPITPAFFLRQRDHARDKDPYPCRFEGGPTCACSVTANAILAVANKTFHHEAKEVLLSHNLLVFEPQNPIQVKEWLESQGPLVKKIRRLDIQFSLFDGKSTSSPKCETWKKKNGTQYHSWVVLAAFIRDNLRLEILDLSIDTVLDGAVFGDKLLDAKYPVLETFRKMVKPLRGFGMERGLKSFTVFFWCCKNEELKAERAVMGPDYVPSGKTKSRNFARAWYPHGVPDFKDSKEFRDLGNRFPGEAGLMWETLAYDSFLRDLRI